MNPVRHLRRLQKNNADINIVPYKKEKVAYRIYEGYNLPRRATWKIHFVYDNGIDLINPKTSKMIFIYFDDIAIIYSKNEFFMPPEAG